VVHRTSLVFVVRQRGQRTGDHSEQTVLIRYVFVVILFFTF
jgi:hypothetical protein